MKLVQRISLEGKPSWSNSSNNANNCHWKLRIDAANWPAMLANERKRSKIMNGKKREEKVNKIMNVRSWNPQRVIAARIGCSVYYQHQRQQLLILCRRHCYYYLCVALPWRWLPFAVARSLFPPVCSRWFFLSFSNFQFEPVCAETLPHIHI